MCECSFSVVFSSLAESRRLIVVAGSFSLLHLRRSIVCRVHKRTNEQDSIVRMWLRCQTVVISSRSGCMPMTSIGWWMGGDKGKEEEQIIGKEPSIFCSPHLMRVACLEVLMQLSSSKRTNVVVKYFFGRNQVFAYPLLHHSMFPFFSLHCGVLSDVISSFLATRKRVVFLSSIPCQVNSAFLSKIDRMRRG